jgi:hypothetical protein
VLARRRVSLTARGGGCGGREHEGAREDWEDSDSSHGRMLSPHPGHGGGATTRLTRGKPNPSAPTT